MSRVDLAGKLHDARARVAGESVHPAEQPVPKFERMVRKDARVRPDQDAALTALAKTVMRARPAKAERITENTLIRVAIDLLLTHADRLRGSTEDELRHSVTSVLPNVRTSAPSQSQASELRNSGTSDFSGPGTPALPSLGGGATR